MNTAEDGREILNPCNHHYEGECVETREKGKRGTDRDSVRDISAYTALCVEKYVLAVAILKMTVAGHVKQSPIDMVVTKSNFQHIISAPPSHTYKHNNKNFVPSTCILFLILLYASGSI